MVSLNKWTRGSRVARRPKSVVGFQREVSTKILVKNVAILQSMSRTNTNREGGLLGRSSGLDLIVSPCCPAQFLPLDSGASCRNSGESFNSTKSTCLFSGIV